MCLEGGVGEERGEKGVERKRGEKGVGVGLRILGEHKIEHKIRASNIIAIHKDARASQTASYQYSQVVNIMSS